MRTIELKHNDSLYTINLDKINFVEISAIGEERCVTLHFGSCWEFFHYKDAQAAQAIYDKIVKAMKKDK